MASLEIDPASGRYRVRFRYAGQEYKRSLRTKSQPVAQASLGQVEEALRMIELFLMHYDANDYDGEPLIDAVSADGDSPHQLASECGELGIVAALLSKGAKVDLRSRAGNTA